MEPFRHSWGESNAKECDWFDAAEHVVLNQDAAEWGFPFDNSVANSFGTDTEVNADQAELYDFPAAILEREQNLPGILISSSLGIQHANINRRAIKSLDRDGHVVGMDKQPLVRLRHFIRWHLNGARALGRIGEQAVQVVEGRGCSEQENDPRQRLREGSGVHRGRQERYQRGEEGLQERRVNGVA